MRPDVDGVLRQVDLSLSDVMGRPWALGTRLLVDDTALAKVNRLCIPFNVSKGDYPTISYAGVVSGEVPLSFFKDKYVLVGATTVGMGDQYTTPQSGSAGLMSGIEIHANILDSFLSGQQIEELISPWLVVVNWVVPLLTQMLLVLAYLLWNWLCLSVVIGYVQAGLSLAQAECRPLLAPVSTSRQRWFVPHSVERGM